MKDEVLMCDLLCKDFRNKYVATAGGRNEQPCGRAGGEFGESTKGAVKSTRNEFETSAGLTGERGPEGGPRGANNNAGKEVSQCTEGIHIFARLE